MQIYNTLTSKTESWKNHPAIKMWRGYENALLEYMNTMIREWIRRGYKNTMRIAEITGPIVYPDWFGDDRFHSAHRASLLFKNWDHYSQFDWKENPKIEYWWPE